MKKRLISLLLALAMVLSFLLVPVSAAKKSSSAATREPLKVLTFGNSFASDSMTLINSIAIDHGDAPMIIGWLYHGGCTLKMHCDYFEKDSESYTYYKDTNGTVERTKKSTALDGLLDEDWDLIFVQNGTGYVGAKAAFDPYLDELMGYINANKTNSDAQFGWNMTWGFQRACKDSGVATYSREFRELFNGNTDAMYKTIVSLVQEKVLPRTVEVDGERVPEFTYLIPSGTAIENARSSYFGDNLQRDTYHLNRLGRIIAAYVWYAKLTGKTQLTSIKLSDETAQMTLTKEDRQVILESVNNALSNPFECTPSKYTQRPAEDVYYVLEDPSTFGGTVEGYHQNDPTTKVTVSYTGKVKNVGAKAFYKLVDGKLVAQRIHDAKVATVSWHNYFVSYDEKTRTLTTKSGNPAQGHGTADGQCGYRCIPDTGNGHYELPYTVYDVPAATPVVDVTGKDHGISTLQDVIDLADAGCDIRLNHYSADASVPAAFYVDEVTIPEDFNPGFTPDTSGKYAMQAGDVFYLLDPLSKGEEVKVLIANAATGTPGAVETITAPNGDGAAFRSLRLGRVTETGIVAVYQNMTEQYGAGLQYKLGVHEHLKAVDTTNKTFNMDEFADGSHANRATCFWNSGSDTPYTGKGYHMGSYGTNACEDTSFECQATNRYDANTAFLDLRIFLATGKVSDIKALAEAEFAALAGDQSVMLDVYVPDGAKGASGTASLVVVMPTNPTKNTVEAPDEAETCPSIHFNDVSNNDWYREAVDYVVKNGVMSGYNASTFGPDDNLSRAMVVQVLYNYENKPATEAEAKFPDVKTADWFYNATRWGAAKGVVSGYGDGRFGPNDNVTIEQVAVILHNYMGKPAGTADLTSVGKYDDWAAGALRWAVENGVLKDVPFTNATETATRAQTAQMLMNFLKK